LNDAILAISLPRLGLAFLPVAVVIAVLARWSLEYRNALYAVARMLVQLLLIGYVLLSLFASDRASIVVAVVATMIFLSSWIALGTVRDRRRSILGKALAGIAIGGGLTLLLVTGGILGLDPWYAPRYVIPLAGMIFANAMNGVSLAAERFYAELERGTGLAQARAVALRAALIPTINSLFAVGLVSLPGMMTGQILAGISPLVAARYQIMVMCMVFGAAGIASACFLALLATNPRAAVPPET